MKEPGTGESAALFSRIKVRVGGIVFCGAKVALIRRDRPDSVHYTPPGGNIEADLVAGLMREMSEELRLPSGQASSPELLRVVDQMVSRPGTTPPPRKLHLLYRLHISEEARAGLATEEHDEQADGSFEVGHVEWIDYRETGDLPIFPPIGPALASLASPTATPADVALPAVTDRTYTWV